MADDVQAAIVSGSTHTIRTLVDGTLTLTLHIEPGEAQKAFAMFGAPGTPVAIAKLNTDVTQERMQKEAAKAYEIQEVQDKTASEADNVSTGQWGDSYRVLFTHGWFHNPVVTHHFKADVLEPEQRVEHIKRQLYRLFEVDSLSNIPPDVFLELLCGIELENTLPGKFFNEAG